MSEDLIDPPVGPGLDVRKFPFMPLDCKALLHSDFLWMVSDAEFRAAIMLWAAAWHQVPAGSVPNNDKALAVLCGFGRDDGGINQFRAIRNGALYGFKLAKDGRLYHPVIVARALEARTRIDKFYADREASRQRMKKTRERRKKTDANQTDEDGCAQHDRNVARNVRDGCALKGKEKKLKTKEKKLKTDTTDRTEQRTPTVAAPASPGAGVVDLSKATDLAEAAAITIADLDTRIGPQDTQAALFPEEEELHPDTEGKTKAGRAKVYPKIFDRFWTAYPRIIGKVAAFKAWKSAVKLAGDPEVIITGAEKFAAMCRHRKTPEDKIPHPTTWLNAGRWSDAELDKFNAGPLEPEKPVRFGDLPGNRMKF